MAFVDLDHSALLEVITLPYSTHLPLILRLCFFQAEDGIRVPLVTGVQTCALPILPEPSQLDSHLVEEAGEEQELTREQPQPDGDDDVARTRRRDEHEAGDYEYGSAQQAHGPPVSGYQTLPGAALVEMVAGLVAVPGVDLLESAPVTPAFPGLLDSAFDVCQRGHRQS